MVIIECERYGMIDKIFIKDSYSIEQLKVYEILTMPIVSTNYSSGTKKIWIENNNIMSTQTYFPYKKYEIPLDPDMSDFAVGFYEIIYKDLLGGKELLNADDDVFDDDFCGDTMNSFNYIANKVPEAGRSIKTRTNKSSWPMWLQQYYDNYHCLSNFWLLPKEVGRKVNAPLFSKGSYEYNICDFMDRFLEHYKKNYNKFQKRYINHSKANDCFKNFAEKHFLSEIYLDENLNVKDFSYNQDPEKIVNEINLRIQMRANAILHSEYFKKIYEYFHVLGLIDEIK
jgi:hypothetical protein